jgi:hypothetical protein
MRFRALVGVAVLAAIALDLPALALVEARTAHSRDGVEALIRISPPAALLFAVAVARHAIRRGWSSWDAALTGAVGAMLTFVLAWTPVILLLVLYPPS